MAEASLHFAAWRASEALVRLTPPWQTLADGLPALHANQTPQWAEAALAHLLDRPDSLWLITAHQDAALVAIWPLEQRGQQLRGLWQEHLYVCDLTARPDAGAQLWPLMWHWLQHDAGLDWRQFLLPRLSDDAVLAHWLRQMPVARMLSTPRPGSAWIDCQRSYAELLRDASANLRSKLSRAGKRAAAHGQLSGQTCTEPQALRDALQQFVQIENSGWKGRDGGAVAQRAELVAFYEQLVQSLGARGQFEIDLLCLGGRAIAATLWLRTGGRLHLQKTAYLESVAELSPGNLLLAYSLQRACLDPQLLGLDFMTRCPWADGWRPQLRPVHSVTLYRDSWRGRAAFELTRASRRFKAAARPLWLRVKLASSALRSRVRRAIARAARHPSG